VIISLNADDVKNVEYLMQYFRAVITSISDIELYIQLRITLLGVMPDRIYGKMSRLLLDK
jgi:hypothetical protein